ncbi:unnamed protein product [Zymoseptoria tritici ST99CH_3D7]|uniref:Uncharacterized protein n=1 Tax=Zymoseptoria tritici (strain ST99CH_3D7) TaxID=1276538 RepID=A0A1X7RWW0_ZYMT9|nr:unnamed protein product [Zymoseptoria tritici ST99CH_3D7]
MTVSLEPIATAKRVVNDNHAADQIPNMTDVTRFHLPDHFGATYTHQIECLASQRVPCAHVQRGDVCTIDFPANKSCLQSKKRVFSVSEPVSKPTVYHNCRKPRQTQTQRTASPCTSPPSPLFSSHWPPSTRSPSPSQTPSLKTPLQDAASVQRPDCQTVSLEPTATARCVAPHASSTPTTRTANHHFLG